MGRRGVVWDTEGEEGMRVIQRKGMGREGGRGGRKEEEDDLAPQKKKFPDSATGGTSYVSYVADSPFYPFVSSRTKFGRSVFRCLKNDRLLE
jgi:hypothetical protein